MKTKRFLRFFVLIICVFCIIYSTNASVSKTQAINIVTTQIYLNQLDSINIYLSPDSIKATYFKMNLYEDSDVSLFIYDQLGRKVLSIPMKSYEKGTHSIDFMNDKLSPGVYYYKISVNNKPLDARKLMVL